MSALHDEHRVLSDEEDDFINQEDALNKQREIERIEQEVLRKQKEIELLLKRKQEEQQLWQENNNDLEKEKERETQRIRQQHKQAEIERQKQYIKHNKRNILDDKGGIVTGSFADKLSSVRSEDRAKLDQKKAFLSSRKYTFGLEDVDNEVGVSALIRALPQPVINEMEKYSGQELSERYIDEKLVEKAFHDKKVLRVDKLFAKVYPPEFKEPEYPNWVVVGIITKKDEPKLTNNQSAIAKQKKYLKLTISNFILEISLMLFGDAFDKYWKLQVGDVIGILNPHISPWKNPATGQYKSFNLTLSTDYDAIIEIGKSKNFGICKAFRKNSHTQCGIPVDRSKTDYCEYHQNLSLKRITANRLELGGLATSGGLNKLKNTNSKQILMNLNYKSNDNKSFGIQIYDNPHAARFNAESDLNSGKVYFSNINAKRAFFDDDYVNPDTLNNIEAKRKRLKNKKKELELMQRLLNISGGESLRAIVNHSSQHQEKDKNENENDKEQQLQSKKNSQILQTAFTTDTLNNLGFDPTRKPFGTAAASNDASLRSDQRGRAREKISLLDSIRRKKKIHLSPSRESKLKRAKTWNANAKSLASYKRETEAKEEYENHLSSATPSPQKPTVNGQQQNQTIQGKKFLKGQLVAQASKQIDDSDDSDSDLDIDFGDNKEAKAKYYATVKKI